MDYTIKNVTVLFVLLKG